MRLKSKIILLAVAPLIVATTIITYLGFQSARDLAEQELAIYEFNLVDAKKQALKNHVNIAMSAIRPILEDDQLEDAEAQYQVKKILAGLSYEDDGYFFAYEMSGVNLVHPTQPDFVGKNLWNFQDRTENYLIQGLIRAAQAGGGYHRYIWEKPPLMKQEDKLGYVVAIDRWDWMMGTGLYLDDIYAELAKTKSIMNDNIQRSFFAVIEVVVVTVVLVILLGLAINLHEHKLADSRLKELAQRFMRLQVNERRGFSRELHDGINQLLVSCKFRIELAENKLKRDHEKEVIHQELAKAGDLINQTISEVRQISHNLRPTLLDDLGLDTALRTLVDQFMERTRIKVAYRFEVVSNIPDEIEITIYRLTQEALTNIEKHAQAKNITLHVWQSYRHIGFECLDDGCGFSQKSVLSSGIGLINMRERLELIGGDFTLESQRGKGTKVQALLPLEQGF
ncbi:cache domain-containing protein [Marinomonas rhodophyticola]|uniref:histidine kinase n=1 Tax=Marinomonas rhodophyticola TaxID=2992803 RepID=A0ABT3KJU7_9GAMM|nr:cache domain-containing protein [Marinomonas sp. KJ51-3]MCW4630833.1 cache domain-containing protein [Marinomonas sp. KJ51-3]